jgi:hypothetical protein
MANTNVWLIRGDSNHSEKTCSHCTAIRANKQLGARSTPDTTTVQTK